ncbi:hypothetical protein, partial [Pantoea eucalypti]|uniref:hypothetical protein n=1 Tax=Pantoea eucalypti TaxID=470933 RepID=UPI0028A1D20F
VQQKKIMCVLMLTRPPPLPAQHTVMKLIVSGKMFLPADLALFSRVASSHPAGFLPGDVKARSHQHLPRGIPFRQYLL